MCGAASGVNLIPGQEESNSDHLLEGGAAVKCINLSALPYKVSALLGNAKRLERMRAAAGVLARPDAANQIIARIAD